MAANKVICHCKNVDYITIRKAMIEGARTVEEIQENRSRYWMWKLYRGNRKNISFSMWM